MALQCVVVIVGLTALLYYINDLHWAQKLVAVAAIVFSSLTTGALLDGQRWAVIAEHIRMGIVLITTLIVFYDHRLFAVMLIVAAGLAVLSTVWMLLCRRAWMQALAGAKTT